MSITGFDAQHPVKSGSSIADVFAGVFTAVGILAALEYRNKTGRGQMVDVAMLDCMIAILENAVATYDATGVSPEPIGNVHRSISPFATFCTADGFINICAGNDDLWRRLCETTGMAEYVEDKRFIDNKSRVENFKALEELLNARLANGTTAEWQQKLDAVKVPCGPIMNMEQVFRDPQVQERQMLQEIVHPKAGSMKVPGVPIKFSETPAAISSPAPGLGQQSAEIYGELLGIDEKELNDLRESGVI